MHSSCRLASRAAWADLQTRCKAPTALLSRCLCSSDARTCSNCSARELRCTAAAARARCLRSQQEGRVFHLGCMETCIGLRGMHGSMAAPGHRRLAGASTLRHQTALGTWGRNDNSVRNNSSVNQFLNSQSGLEHVCPPFSSEECMTKWCSGIKQQSSAMHVMHCLHLSGLSKAVTFATRPL